MSVVRPAKTLTVRVTGDREASLPTTWGQRSNTLWHGQIDEDQHHEAGTCYEIPMGCGIDAVADAIGRVLARHDALRSVFRHDNGELRQLIERSGTATVDVFDTTAEDAGGAVDAAISHLCASPWNGRQWPMRWAIVATDPALSLVVAYNRLILDAFSAGLVVNEVLKNCTGESGDELAPAWQVIEEARYEQSPDGAAANARAVEYWRDILSRSPRSLFDLPVQPCEDNRYTMASIESPAIGRAVQMMRKRWRVTGATLLLSAAAIVLGRYTGHSEVVMQTVSGNRGDRNRRHMIGTLTAQGLLRLEVADRPFGELARQAFRASSDAHRSSYYDPDEMLALRTELGRQRGACLDLGALFNDRRTGLDMADIEPVLTEQELRGIAAAGDLTDGSAAHPPPDWHGSYQVWPVSPTQKDARFLLMCHHDPTNPASLFCDMRYLPLTAAQQMLGGMERILVAAACADLSTAELGRISGVEPVSRGPSFVYSDGGWCDLAAANRLWRQVTGADHGVVVAEPADRTGETRLVGYAAVTTPPAALHRSFVAAVGTRNDVRTPDWYRLVTTAPADPADTAAWRRAAVVAEADGRS